MRLSAIAAIVAGAGIAQVAAAPIRIVITSTQPTNAVFEKARFGHAVPLPPAVGSWNVVAANGVKVPAVLWLAPHPTPPSPYHASRPPHCPRKRTPAHVESDFKILPVSATPHFDNAPASHHYHHHRHGKFPSHDFQNRPFTHRLNHALLHLGRWEGRAVAFVLGCGIGVLLRLFWVLSIVMYRAIRGRRDDEHEYTHVAFVEEYEEPPVLSPLPSTFTP
ncbi:hypothetical protein CPB84DRAFT_1959485 [Gymnopilus junonius]|uniref:Uncharacterized protein n=1 Tax=Gymnopilus junonius TaxID=109634 RepID=A0A9P5NXN3_GYMJU|nr:hypothetical protein CPB84DRAFT_1959485 [Gymnopilus junonius]